MTTHQDPESPFTSDNPATAVAEPSINAKTKGSVASRRKMLGALGVGVGAAVAIPGVALAQTAGDGGRNGRGGNGGRGGDGDRDGRDGNGGGGGANGGGTPVNDRFNRFFDDLPSFAEPSAELRAALVELGRPGGIMDANDDLSAGAARLFTDPALSVNNPDNPTNVAGVTYLGQFIDHDLTLDAGSRLGRPTPARRSTNLRTPRFDLDSVYGGGPEESPDLYDGFRFRIETGGLFEDLPRDEDGIAIISDGRNDENLIISGLHAAFLSFHNAVIDSIATGVPTANDFQEARRTVELHYQWIVVNEVLPQYVGQDMVDSILISGFEIFDASAAQIPFEFQTSAYRMGHAMIRPSYRANFEGDDDDPFFALMFDPSTFGDEDPDDLSGQRRGRRRFIDWQTFFDFGDGNVAHNKRINTTMSTPLFQLPTFSIPTVRGEDLGPTSLASRNLLRHITWEVPSGQAIAQQMGVDPLSAADLSDLSNLGANLDTSTPLFFYILREADIFADGLHLGPIGGRMVAEVFLGLLELDQNSYLNVADDWRPTLPQRNGSVGDDFTMVDLLTVAGVDPSSRQG